jgi:Glycosyl transferase family 90
MKRMNYGDPPPKTTCHVLERAAKSLLKQLRNSNHRSITHQFSSLHAKMKEDLNCTTERRNVTTSYPPTYQYSFFGWWWNRKRKNYPVRDDIPSLHRKAPKFGRSWTGLSMALIVVLSFISTFYSSIIIVRDYGLRGGPPKSPSATGIQYLTGSRNLARQKSDALQRNRSSSMESNHYRPNNRLRTFPKWGATIEEENSVGLSLEPMLDFLFTSSAYITPMSSVGNKHMLTNSSNRTSYRPILNLAWTETLYLVEPGGTLWTSQKHRDVQNVSGKPKVERRFNNTERLMLQALDILRREYQPQKSCAQSQWPTLCQTVFPTSPSGGQGFPFLSWYGDFDGCNHHNWVASSGKAVSVPLFTVAARVDCNYTIPFPNYYSHLMSSATEWDRLFDLYRQRYPWTLKTSVVAWRGGMTGIIHNATTKCPRWRMVQAAQAIDASRAPPRFDVAINNLPPRARPFAPRIEADVGKIHKQADTLDFIDFQKYRAVLDIDGNSWSGRFGSLLCFNSVILKVKPTFVDYFYHAYDNPNGKTDYMEHSLQPWKHYIPVQADFSDLEQQAAYALDPKNDAAVQEIIRNANDWCRRTMLEDSFARDMLNVWERYVQLLYVSDPEWNRGVWKNEKARVVAASSPFEMVPLHMRNYPSHNNVVEMFPVEASSS